MTMLKCPVTGFGTQSVFRAFMVHCPSSVCASTIPVSQALSSRLLDTVSWEVDVTFADSGPAAAWFVVVPGTGT